MNMTTNSVNITNYAVYGTIRSKVDSTEESGPYCCYVFNPSG